MQYDKVIKHYQSTEATIMFLSHEWYSIMTVERISSYKLENTKHDNESDPT